MYLSTPSQMKLAEENAVKKGSSYSALMDSAGAACAKVIADRMDCCGKNALILCGKGNNGGDGFVISELLAQKGARVTVVMTSTSAPMGIALEKYERLSGYDNIKIVSAADLDFNREYDIICDAVFGTGFHGELTDELCRIFSALDKKDCFKLAVDIPSGADSISGCVSRGTMSFDCTVTFGAVKMGMMLSPAKKYCGEIILAPIGIDDSCFEEIGGVPFPADDFTAAMALPVRTKMSHKGCFGRLLIAGGSSRMSGAAAMNVTAALRSGCGIVTLASTERVTERTANSVFEATYLPLKENSDGGIDSENISLLISEAEKYDVIAAGSGMMACEDTRKIISALIEYCGDNGKPIILDADGLNSICGCIDIIRNAKCNAVLTPHPAELGRLLDMSVAQVMSDRLGAARSLARKTGAVVVAKGYPTFIVSPEDKVCASYTGNAGLSKGGSGDVLTGVISGICTSNKGKRLFESACAGVYIFGAAADITAGEMSMTGMLPSDVIARLPFAFKQIEEQRG